MTDKVPLCHVALKKVEVPLDYTPLGPDDPLWDIPPLDEVEPVEKETVEVGPGIFNGPLLDLPELEESLELDLEPKPFKYGVDAAPQKER